jgi:hypothetical protein
MANEAARTPVFYQDQLWLSPNGGAIFLMHLPSSRSSVLVALILGRHPNMHLHGKNLSDQLEFKCSIQNSGWNP